MGSELNKLSSGWIKVKRKKPRGFREDINDISEVVNLCNGCHLVKLRGKHGSKLKVSRHAPWTIDKVTNQPDCSVDCHVDGKLVAWFMSIDHCCGMNWYEALDKKNRDPLYE